MAGLRPGQLLRQLTVLAWLAVVWCQDDGGGGDDMSMDMDMDSMLGGDEDGGGRGGKMGGKVIVEEFTYIEQTTRALQQLALVIGRRSRNTIALVKYKAALSLL